MIVYSKHILAERTLRLAIECRPCLLNHPLIGPVHGFRTRHLRADNAESPPRKLLPDCLVEDIGNAPITLALQVQDVPLYIPHVGADSWYRSTLLRFSAGYNHLIRLVCVVGTRCPSCTDLILPCKGSAFTPKTKRALIGRQCW